MMMHLELVAFFALLAGCHSIPVTDENEGKPFGVDCSFPIHYKSLRCGDILGDRRKVYEDYMAGCRERYGDLSCDNYENDRIEMSLRQPQSMVVSQDNFVVECKNFSSKKIFLRLLLLTITC